jgi:hypothetical protein
MLEPMDSADAQNYWKFRIENDERFERDRFDRDQFGLACYKQGMEDQKKKLNVRKTI